MHAKRTVSAISSLGVAALLGCASQALAQTAVPEAAGLETRSPSRGTVLAPPATLSGATDNRALFTTTQKGQAAAASFQIDNLQPVRDSTPAVLGVNLGPSDGSSSAGIGVEGQGGRYGLAGYGTSQDATGVVARGGFTGVDASGDRIGVNASGGFVGVEATGDFNGVIGTATFVDNAEGGTGVLGSGFIGVAGSSDSGSAAVFTGGAEGGGSCTYSGGAGWSCTSDRNQKENFHPINPRTILEKLSIVEISGWTMKGDKQRTPHIGPTAQDFHAAFKVGGNERTINTADAQGVALAAIKGLHAEVLQKERGLAQLRNLVAELQKKLAGQAVVLADLGAALRRTRRSAPAPARTR
ncbi:tail fiber domain-containing protein [Gloeobacter morelensis]|uniref:tail fiber domain-containing protein n=1 Tax=Gloeobacter morelensis TaxID=2907343 RepID=UPI001E65110D|nr:tail fiber domain-containing protein [Gloeobacter morelensis]UFP97248.1 tail fiber domain-containing protein [Gloeobacter morelensis MG652769]